jgi:hypothetical protein
MRSLVLASLLALSLGTCGAQSAAGKSVEPAAIGEAFHLDPSGQALTPLPEEQWKAKGKAGWTTSTGILQIPGERSSFRMKAQDKEEFIFKTEHPESTRLYPFTVKKNLRQYELVKLKGMGRERETHLGTPVEVTKFGESSYKMVPKSPLAPGEYAIDIAGKLFTFGIDQ